jgi:hypothetical protein
VIILQLFPGFLTNGIADIHELPPKAGVKKLGPKKRDEYLSLLENRQKELASAFRKRMTSNQTYDSPNDYRKDFYVEVINEAENVNFLSFPVCENDHFSSLWIGANKSKRTKMNLFLNIAGTSSREAKAFKKQAKIFVAS